MPDPKKIEPEIMPPDTPREYSAIAARQATVRAFGELLVTVYAPQLALLTSRGREMSGTKPPDGVLPERDPGPMFKADNKERGWGLGEGVKRMFRSQVRRHPRKLRRHGLRCAMR